MSLKWVTEQISRSAANRSLPLDQHRFNPRPAGVIRDGSATQAVLVFLQQNPKRFYSHFQIVHGTGRTYKSVNWGLLFLRSIRMVECVPDEQRNSRYLRYRASMTEKRRA